MRFVHVIGIGAGDPAYLTWQAIEAIRASEVIFLVDKGSAKDELNAIRTDIVSRFAPAEQGYHHRYVTIAEPARDRSAAAYTEAVSEWLGRRALAFETALERELGASGVGAFLVWGDPTLYDGTIRILDALRERGRVELDFDVIPGISAVQALVARHRLPMNRIGEAILVTPARLIESGLPPGLDNVFVMLDRGLAAARLAEQEGASAYDIYWGAYLGTSSEVLLSGPLDLTAPAIATERARLRAEKGWIMDTYLIRRRLPDDARDEVVTPG